MTATETDSYVYRRSAVPDAIDDEYCQNCSFLVPKDVSGRIPKGAPGSPSMDGKSRNGSPVLRTSQSVTAYGSPSQHSSGTSFASRNGNRFSSKTDTASFSSSSSSSTSENNDLAHSSPSSSLYMTLPTHTHRLKYISTRYPTAPAAYSNLRRSCIRTLSTENLPRGSGSGSLFFGDSIAGYSVTHVFRLPDPLARGRLRTYALIALGSRDNWKVSQVILEITRTFERLASRIVAMANRVLDNEAAAEAVSDAKNDSAGSSTSTSAPTRPTTNVATKGSGGGRISAPTTPTVSATKTFTLREKSGDGTGSPSGGREVTETFSAEIKDDGDEDHHHHRPTQQESPIDATKPASTPKESQAAQASTKDTSSSSTINTTTTNNCAGSTVDTANPKVQEQQQRTNNSSVSQLQLPQPERPEQEQGKEHQEQDPPKRPQPVPLRSMTPLSSFLAAKKVDPDGYPRDSHSASSMLEDAKKRGLAEIVGQEDFFVELHASFVVILARLVGEFGVR